MTLEKIARVVYGLLGIVYVLVGAGAMLLPTGWLPQRLMDDISAGLVATWDRQFHSACGDAPARFAAAASS